VDPERINTIEVWRDAEALQQWRNQANAPRLGKPKYMSVQRYDATDGGPLFLSRPRLPRPAPWQGRVS
jgi:hypothetical protein